MLKDIISFLILGAMLLGFILLTISIGMLAGLWFGVMALGVILVSCGALASSVTSNERRRYYP